ncbi:MAG: 3-carboxy-cis,cis-muconate cycloisomerase [Terracidiphilus sp.]
MTDGLNSYLFSTPEMSRVFAPDAQLRAMMRFEWALTCALEKHGLAEAGSGAALQSLLAADFIEVDALARDARENGNLAIPFVRQLTSAVERRHEAAARTVHLGATSQDVLDTALVLQMHHGLQILNESVDKLEQALARQVKLHADTVLSGRTWLQAGPPTTLGLKLAGTLAALRRHRARLRTSAERFLVVQFGGAVGTRAALGTAGDQVAAELARILELKEPSLPWHTQRDNLVEAVQVLALLTGSLAKFAKDIALLMQTEVGEVSEGRAAGRGGSSSMPHKHNPVACAAVLAVHATMPSLAATMLTAMPQEHERGLGLWQAEWETVPEAFRRTAAALAYATEIAEQLEADPARMLANLDAALGVPMAEAVSVALAQKIGRSKAHALLRDATARAQQEQRYLGDVLKQLPEVVEHLTPTSIDRLLDPHHYLGSAQAFIERVLGDVDAGD